MMLLKHLVDDFEAFLLSPHSMKPVAIRSTHWSSRRGNRSGFASVYLLEWWDCFFGQLVVRLSEGRWLL